MIVIGSVNNILIVQKVCNNIIIYDASCYVIISNDHKLFNIDNKL